MTATLARDAVLACEMLQGHLYRTAQLLQQLMSQGTAMPPSEVAEAPAL
jgi:hypothetical protein